MSAPYRFRWECTCPTCRQMCNDYVRGLLAEALFGWLRAPEAQS